MRGFLTAGLLLAAAACAAGGEPPADATIARFKAQEIEKGFDIGYAVTLADLDGDGKKDVVVADSTRVVWYQNPDWERRIILQGGTKPHNVCIEAHDVDGDGRLDLVLGAGWKGLDPKAEGTLQWLRRGKTRDEPWTVYPIDTEPSVHRIRFADVDGDGRAELVSAPLLGRGSSAKGNWMDAPVRVTAYRVPKDPTADRWEPIVLDQKLHVVHNLWPVPAAGGGKRQDILTASYEGVSLLSLDGGKATRRHLGAGDQKSPKGSRGASEIKQGTLKNGRRYLATIEPWHGDQVVVYTEPAEKDQLWDRYVVDARLKWGHGVWCADLDGDGGDELIIGVRDDRDPKTDRRGVRVYRATDGRGAAWERQVVDHGGIAVEDLAAADLDGDGRVDIVAVGRQTHNGRIYWNRGVK